MYIIPSQIMTRYLPLVQQIIVMTTTPDSTIYILMEMVPLMTMIMFIKK